MVDMNQFKSGGFKPRPKVPDLNPEVMKSDFLRNTPKPVADPVADEGRGVQVTIPAVTPPQATPLVEVETTAKTVSVTPSSETVHVSHREAAAPRPAPQTEVAGPVAKTKAAKSKSPEPVQREVLPSNERILRRRSKTRIQSYRWQILLPVELTEAIEGIADKHGQHPNRVMEAILRHGLRDFDAK